MSSDFSEEFTPVRTTDLELLRAAIKELGFMIARLETRDGELTEAFMKLERRVRKIEKGR